MNLQSNWTHNLGTLKFSIQNHGHLNHSMQYLRRGQKYVIGRRVMTFFQVQIV